MFIFTIKYSFSLSLLFPGTRPGFLQFSVNIYDPHCGTLYSLHKPGESDKIQRLNYGNFSCFLSGNKLLELELQYQNIYSSPAFDTSLYRLLLFSNF